MGLAVPHRYLVAYLGSREPDRRALLRFPPGAILEDAGHCWLSVFHRAYGPELPPETVEHLLGLGVEIVAVGRDAVSKVFSRATAPLSSVDAFAEDYLDVNARLGGARCVTVGGYAMDTEVDGGLLCHVLRESLLQREDVRMHCDVAFRARGLPRVLGIRLADLDRLPRFAFDSWPCLLHGDGCRNHSRRWPDPLRGYCHDARWVILDNAHPRRLGARVMVPRRLLDWAIGSDVRRATRAAWEIVRRDLLALPDDTWRDANAPRDLAPAVAIAMSQTCEERAMLAEALWQCWSVREVFRRARDASWVVSRTLEGLRD